VDGGLPSVLSQTFRSMIHSRMELGMKHYERAYPDTDIILIEPDHRDPELYLANTFSYGAAPPSLAEHAYQQTRQMLRSRRRACQPSWPARHQPEPRRTGRPQGATWHRRGAHPDWPRHCHGEESAAPHCRTHPGSTLDLFNRFGEPNVSTTLISAELRISPGNLYYHYPAKDELINALFDRMNTR
jgi:hypothetical protein